MTKDTEQNFLLSGCCYLLDSFPSKAEVKWNRQYDVFFFQRKKNFSLSTC